MTQRQEKKWDNHHGKLTAGMVFIDRQGGKVMLDRRVAGSTSQWYIAGWWDGRWHYNNAKQEPCDLIELISANDCNGICQHCGRDNKGYEVDRCSDDCPLY
jgi:hypothetical protein